MKITITAILALVMLGNYALAQSRVTINGVPMKPPQEGPSATDMRAALGAVLSQRDREMMEAVETAVKTNRALDQLNTNREDELDAWAAQVQGYLDEIAALKRE